MTPSIRSCDTCGADNQAQARFCRACGRALQAVAQTMYSSTTGQLLPGIPLKHYRIINSLGKGGFGAVYLAEDTQLDNRRVALKEMSLAGLNHQEQEEAANAFRQEAMMLAHLHHPNLPSIFDHFEENQRWYLVMSFIEGETLEDYLSKHQDGKLPLNEVLAIGIQLCAVLDYLHNRQPPIIFRDLKPANIMRTLNGQIYLIDFGIARHFKPGQAKDTLALGSPGYAAPEQYGKAQTTPRSDIYSLGAILHQLCSGHNPASSAFRFPPLQSLTPTIPATLATYITQMLDMDEGKRPTNIALVQKVLQAARGNPVAPLLPGSQQHSVPPLPPPQPKPYVSTSYASAGTLLFRYAARPRGIETVRWSPDGTRIVISNGKTLQVLSLTSNKQPSFIDENLPKSILSMTWSPDGNIAAVAADGTMHIWNAEDSGLPLIFQEKLPNSLIAWSPDLTRIAFPGKDETVQVVSLLNRQTVMYECRSRGLFGSEKRENAYLHQICWSPDGTHLAALSQERSVFVWSTNGGGQHFSPEPRYKSRDKGALSFAWSADGTSLAAVSQERSIFVWSTNGSRQRFSPKPRDRYKYHRDFSLSPDGTSIALFSYGSIELWNFCQNNYFAITYKYIHEHKGHPKRGYSGEYYQNLHPIRTMSWSPDGSRIAFAFLDGTIRVWNTDGSGPPLIYNHSDVFEKAFLAWSPDGKYLAFTSRSYLDTDSEVRIWYLGDDDALIYRGHLDSIKALAWAPDSKRITSASCDSLQVWNVSDAFIDEPDFSIVWSFEQLPDGTPIASASDGRKIHFFDAAGQKQPFIDDNIADSFVAKSPNGKYIARVFNKTTIQVANADRSGRSFSYTNHSRAVLVIAWSPDSTRIASASEDGTIHVWYVNGNGQPVIYQAHSGMIQSLAWSPDSTCIVSASKASEDAIHVWNAHDGRQLFIYRGHNYRAFGIFVSSVAWSPDGKRIASSTSGAPDAPNSIGKIVHVWNADGSGPPFIYKGHDSGVSLVKWSPDGTKIVSVSEDGVVLVWSAG